MINEHGDFYLHKYIRELQEYQCPHYILNRKDASCTLLSSLLKVKFSGKFCSHIESISTILSAAWNKTNSSSHIFCFLGDFLGLVGVLKSDGLDVPATAQELIFFTTFYKFFFKIIDTYDWMSGR